MTTRVSHAADATTPETTATEAAAREATPRDVAATAPDKSAGYRAGNLIPEDAVRDMFDEIAPVYDRMNTLLTLGADDRWRRAAVRSAALRPGDAVLDAACGTGKLAAVLADRVGPFGRVVGVDLSRTMIDLARGAHGDLVQLEFRVANVLRLPFDTSAFDAATIAFGIRNVADFEAGFRELARVVRPDGHVVCLELSTPRPRLWGRLFLTSFRHVAPLLGAVFGHRDAYRYLPDSLEGFPDPDQLARAMTAAGLRDVRWRRLGFGTVALHTGVVPSG